MYCKVLQLQLFTAPKRLWQAFRQQAFYITAESHDVKSGERQVAISDKEFEI